MEPTSSTPARTSTAAEQARDSFLGWYEGETREAYEIDLRLLFTWCADEQLDPFAVTRLDLERWVRHLIDKRGNRPSTVRRRVACVRRFYRLAAHDGLIRVSPADYVRLPRSLNVPPGELSLGLPRADFGRLLTAARVGRPVDGALVALLGLMGLRVSEACATSIDGLGQENGHRVLRFIGKGNKPAVSPIPIPVWRYLEPVIGARGSGPILLRSGRGPMNRAAAARALARLSRAAGIDRPVTPHDLRRAFISNMLDAGVSIRDAQTAARHADPRMTMRYDRARHSLDRRGEYVLATFIAGVA